ncbi:MAG: hypothetical protein JW881_14640 [Spirochaetales bacterium]|nr:hypothetical protein [Spirochaetales bacterium]
MGTGTVFRLLNDIFKFKQLDGEFAETKKRIIRIRLSLATGLSVKKFTPTSPDTSDELNKIVAALKKPEFGCADFPFDTYNV